MALKACVGKRCKAGQINHFVRVTTTNNYLGITSIRVITHFMCLATDIALYMCVYNFPSPFFFFFFPQEKIWGVDDGASQHAQKTEEQQKERRDVHVGHAERYHTLRWHLSTDRRRGRAGELAATSPRSLISLTELGWNTADGETFGYINWNPCSGWVWRDI